MVICIISLVVFSFLGIFSAKYRKLAKEAFKCVAKRMTFRRCEAGFDRRMKMKLVTTLSRYSPTFGGAVYKHFEAFSWGLIILMFASMYYSAVGLYNITNYGSCDPHSKTCIFNPGVITCGDPDCKVQCDCESPQVGCAAPTFRACAGDCTCNPGP